MDVLPIVDEISTESSAKKRPIEEAEFADEPREGEPLSKKHKTGEEPMETVNDSDRLRPGHPKYVPCVESYNEDSKKVWIVACFRCKKPLHLTYDPNLKEYEGIQGWEHSEHAKENRTLPDEGESNDEKSSSESDSDESRKGSDESRQKNSRVEESETKKDEDPKETKNRMIEVLEKMANEKGFTLTKKRSIDRNVTPILFVGIAWDDKVEGFSDHVCIYYPRTKAIGKAVLATFNRAIKKGKSKNCGYGAVAELYETFSKCAYYEPCECKKHVKQGKRFEKKFGFPHQNVGGFRTYSGRPESRPSWITEKTKKCHIVNLGRLLK
jgi:hypothetical protein